MFFNYFEQHSKTQLCVIKLIIIREQGVTLDATNRQGVKRQQLYSFLLLLCHYSIIGWVLTGLVSVSIQSDTETRPDQAPVRQHKRRCMLISPKIGCQKRQNKSKDNEKQKHRRLLNENGHLGGKIEETNTAQQSGRQHQLSALSEISLVGLALIWSVSS